MIGNPNDQKKEDNGLDANGFITTQKK